MGERFAVGTTAARLREVFQLDLRALALCRIALGLTILLDLATRADDLRVFYTDGAVVARGCVVCVDGSLHNVSGATSFIVLLFTLQAVCTVAMTVGYHTRLSTCASWVLLLSLHHRNTLILQGGDDVLVATLFWAIFLPWGERLSVDSRGVAVRPNRVMSAASVAFLAQIALVYALTGHYKTGAQWRETHDAVYYVLMAQQYSVGASEWVLRYPVLLKFATVAVVYVETYFPLLLFFPWGTRHLRLGLLTFLFGFHISILALMNVGLFPIISMAIALCLIPSAALDRFRPEPPRYCVTRRWENVACGVILAVVIASVFPLVSPAAKLRLRGMLRPTGLNQRWTMFAPEGGTELFWHVIRVERSGGEQLNDFPDLHPLSFERPARANTLYKNQRWLKLMVNLWFQSQAPTTRRLLERSCRRGDFTSAELLMLLQPIKPNYEYGPRSEVSIQKITCPK